MARVTYVKKAQQRYATVPVIDPETGRPKQTPVMNTRTGEQKVTKSGRPVFRTATVEDRSKPLPNATCGKCGKEIKPGDPYKWIQPKSGPYGGRRLTRCGTCPAWHVWEYSSSLSARTQEIAYNAEQALVGVTTEDEVQAALDSMAEEIRALAEEKRESAQNIEDGFGHETYTSSNLNEQADELDNWADEVESTTIPDVPEPEEADCEDCDGTGKVESDEEDGEEEDCETCEGTGQHTPDEPTEEQMDEWRSEVTDAITFDSPV